MTYFADWNPIIFYLVFLPGLALGLTLVVEAGFWLVDRVYDFLERIEEADWHD